MQSHLEIRTRARCRLIQNGVLGRRLWWIATCRHRHFTPAPDKHGHVEAIGRRPKCRATGCDHFIGGSSNSGKSGEGTNHVVRSRKVTTKNRTSSTGSNVEDVTNVAMKSFSDDRGNIFSPFSKQRLITHNG